MPNPRKLRTLNIPYCLILIALTTLSIYKGAYYASFSPQKYAYYNYMPALCSGDIVGFCWGFDSASNHASNSEV